MPYKDKQKQKESQFKWYLRNKSQVDARTQQGRLEKKQYIANVKSQHACTCGEDDFVCKDFHHCTGKKEFKISAAIRLYGLRKIKRELAKCEVLCANCHRKKHKNDNKPITKNEKRIRNRAFVLEYRLAHPCIKCNERDPYCLDFHHIHGKDIDIRRATCDCGLKRLQEEIAKCIVLCANCHRKEHHRLKNETV